MNKFLLSDSSNFQNKRTTWSLLCPLGRQDSEDLDCLIVAADMGLLWLTCLLFNLEWFWDSLLDSWTDYLMSPFENYPLNDAQ